MHMIEKQHTMFAFGHNTSLFYLRSRDSDPILIPHLKIYSTLLLRRQRMPWRELLLNFILLFFLLPNSNIKHYEVQMPEIGPTIENYSCDPIHRNGL